MSALPVVVSGLAATAVKGLRLTPREAVELDRSGARDNRRFYVVDDRARMLNGKQLGELSAVVADYRDADRRMILTFPDGAAVSGTVELGPAIDTRFFSRAARGRRVRGPWSEALSAYVGRPLRLVEADPRQGGVDRGRAGAVSLVSRASLGALAHAAGEGTVDARRFRMLVEVDGAAAHEEDGWVGTRLRVGAAVVRVHGHVGRCLVTTRHPETGSVDLPVLDVLRSYRGDAPTTAPLAFGIYGAVLEPGVVRVGDRVEPG